jgi:hypothetical protein
MAKRKSKHSDLVPFPASFQRSIAQLRAKAAKATTIKEAIRIRDAGYRAQDRARAEAARDLWEPMLDVVDDLGRRARASAEEAQKKLEEERYADIARLRQIEREEMRRQWWRYNPGEKHASGRKCNPEVAAAKRRAMRG